MLGRIHCWGKVFLGSCECAIPLLLLLLSFSATVLVRAVQKARDRDLLFYLREKEICRTD